VIDDTGGSTIFDFKFVDISKDDSKVRFLICMYVLKHKQTGAAAKKEIASSYLRWH